MATPQSVAADERRFLAEIICKKAVRPLFDSGMIPQNPDVDSFRGNVSITDIVDDDVWDEVLQRVLTWQDQEDRQEDPPLAKVLKRFTRFPTVDRVRDVFGAARSEEYRAALEAIECNASTLQLFPAERYAYPWRKFDMDAAVSAVTEVIAPNIDMPENMTESLAKLVGELRARRRERSSMDSAEPEKRKSIARSLGIWFPMTKDLGAWRTDPRTAPHMPLFIETMNEVMKRMRLVRSYLQYVPRRRLSARACADLAQNIKRMRAYLRGFDRARQ